MNKRKRKKHFKKVLWGLGNLIGLIKQAALDATEQNPIKRSH